MSILNNREIAVAIWLAIFLAFILTKPDVRESLTGLFKLLFSRYILSFYILAWLYTACGVYTIYLLGLWEIGQLKDTVIWATVVVFITLMDLNKVKENKNYFKEAVRDNFKLSLITEFVLGLYAFSLPIELITVPLVTLTVVMKVYAEAYKQYTEVLNFLNWLLLLFGALLLGYSIYQISVHVQEFASLETLRDLLLSPFLALWFLPFIYVISLYMTYEVNLMVMKNAIRSPDLLKYARFHALISFNLDTEGFNRWKSQLFHGSIDTKDQIKTSIKEIKRLQRIEKNPPKVLANLGWSPYQAKSFLSKTGIETGYYNNAFEDDWYACSHYVKLDEDILSNNIAYYVEGSSSIAKTLKLCLNVNSKEKARAAHEKLLEWAEELHIMSLNKPITETIKKAIIKGTDKRENEALITVSVQKEDWLNNAKGYSLIFTILHK